MFILEIINYSKKRTNNKICLQVITTLFAIKVRAVFPFTLSGQTMLLLLCILRYF